MFHLKNINILFRATSLVLIIFLFQAASCDKEEIDYVEVWPRMPMSVEPPDESILLGDTLWVSIDFPDTVEDYLTKKYYKIVDYDFYTSLMFLKLIGPTIDQGKQPAAAGNFNFYPKIGQVYDIGSLSGKLKFDYSSSRYRAKVGLVAKQKGVFSLIMLYRGADKPFNEVVVDPFKDGKKRIYYTTHLSYIINNGNFHFDLYEANCLVPPQLKSDPLLDEAFGTYTFEVK